MSQTDKLMAKASLLAAQVVRSQHLPLRPNGTYILQDKREDCILPPHPLHHLVHLPHQERILIHDTTHTVMIIPIVGEDLGEDVGCTWRGVWAGGSERSQE